MSTVNDLTNGVYAQLLRYILKGYSTETDVPEEMLERLPLFIDMVLIENIVDELNAQRAKARNRITKTLRMRSIALSTISPMPVSAARSESEGCFVSSRKKNG